MNEVELQGGEIIRLKKDHPDRGLNSGDCGLLWGIYDSEAHSYIDYKSLNDLPSLTERSALSATLRQISYTPANRK